MGFTITASTKLQIPINKAVGAQHAPTASNPSGAAAAQFTVPAPSPLIINGKATPLIDVRAMGPSDVVNAINNANIAGVSASINASGALLITGVVTIDGDGNLRGILGV